LRLYCGMARKQWVGDGWLREKCKNLPSHLEPEFQIFKSGYARFVKVYVLGGSHTQRQRSRVKKCMHATKGPGVRFSVLLHRYSSLDCGHYVEAQKMTASALCHLPTPTHSLATVG